MPLADNRDDKVTETNSRRFTTTSRLRLTPTADDDYKEYSCQAKHKALQPDMPMRATVQLSVLCKYLYQLMLYQFYIMKKTLLIYFIE